MSSFGSRFEPKPQLSRIFSENKEYWIVPFIQTMFNLGYSTNEVVPII